MSEAVVALKGPFGVELARAAPSHGAPGAGAPNSRLTTAATTGCRPARSMDHPSVHLLIARLWRPRTAVLVGALALGACGSSDPAAPPPPCPRASLLDGAERTSAYRNDAEPRPAELRYLAVLTNLASGCRYVSEGVEIDLTFSLIAERGPAFSSTPEEVTYFIATLGPDRQILTKDTYPAELDFEEGYAGARWSEELTLLIRSVTPAQAADYTLYVGFQLDDAELRRREQPVLR